MSKRKKYNGRKQRQGLILLIVLGMLAMFTLLAVTYVVSAGSSRQGSLALAVKARGGNVTIKQTARNVLKDLIRGTNNQKSPFYKNSVLEDVFGPNPIRTQFGPYNSAVNSVRRFAVPSTNVNLVKLAVNPAALLNGPLSSFENEYNSRIITILEGPLTGQSFRILKYIGYVRGGTESMKLWGTSADPNIDGTPWSFPMYVDNPTQNGHIASDIEYSILIDLDEVLGQEFVGEYTDVDLTVKSASQSLDKWIQQFGISSLFYFKTTPASVLPTTNTMVGYKFLINDAPFTNAGIGLEDVAMTSGAANQGFGSLDSRRLLRTAVKVPPAILTHYDYLQDPLVMAPNVDGTWGVDGIGNTTRDWTQASAFTQFALNGASNEGYDVPGWQDPYLANQTYVNGSLMIKPSYHDPAVVNYVSHLFGAPSSMNGDDVKDMLRLIDASTARIMSYHMNKTNSTPAIDKNLGFRSNDSSVEDATSGAAWSPNKTYRLPPSFVWSFPPTIGQVTALQKFVKSQIMGVWDVDNDGDRIPDSVWIDPGMQTVFSPDGRRLRPLAAILIEDLDNRVNLNTSGDRVQGNTGYDSTNNIGFDATTGAHFKRSGVVTGQGFGVGPREISLTPLFNFNTKPPFVYSFASSLSPSGPNYAPGPATPAHNPNRFSFFDELVGARRYNFRPIVFPYVNDRVPGIPRAASYPSLSMLSEREFHLPWQNNRLPAMPLSKRSTVGMSFDALGNPVFVNPAIVDGDPYNVTNANPASFPSETLNDGYEVAAMETPISDDPLSLLDLEAILRKYDEDASTLSPRLRDKLRQIPGYAITDFINREITVRSAELRYPNLATAMKITPPVASPGPTDLAIAGQSPGKGTPSYLRYIKMLHSQRFRNQTFPPDATDDPEISYAALTELFPVDFTKGLRMDLNRPFGNGYDDDGDGQVDEPQEISSVTETELYPLGSGSVPAIGAYTREIKPFARKLNAQVSDSNAAANPFPSQTRGRLGSRQILARNLYCLAQLIIPRDFVFPGMASAPNALARARIRGKAIAQWAVNVVDFRDADAAMTRFEFDILPFGSNTGAAANFGTGTAGSLPLKVAGWAPDRIQHNGNRAYVGVVWGMEMPELLLTETLAMHDKRTKDTDLDTTQALTTSATPDNDFDQLRFPLASLFMEVYNPRTTRVSSDIYVPGVPSSLYNSSLELQLDKMAPPSAAWGAQPVWRIAISEVYPGSSTTHPQARLDATTSTVRGFETVTHQWSIEGVTGGASGETALAGVADIDRNNTALPYIENHLGTDLRYDLADPAATPPAGFERFVWFTNTPPTGLVPDILPSLRTAGLDARSVYVSSTAGATLGGGSYMVVGPRAVTEIGSLTHNPFNGYSYPTTLTSAQIAVATNRPVFSPSFQRIDLRGGVKTTLLNNIDANKPWIGSYKAPSSLICSTGVPSASWTTAFPGGIGINVSFPTPVAGSTIWTAGNIPTTKFNTTDTGPRADGSAGFADAAMPPDSWINVSAPVPLLPDTPIDNLNDVLNGPLNAKPGLPDRRNTGTYENVRAAYLQRLADPDFAYDPVTNPYITVDWMSIDLTVFNGEAPLPGTPGADPMDTIAGSNTLKFQSRYKNGALSPLAATTSVANKGVSVHSPVTSSLRATVAQTTLPATAVVTGVSPNPNPQAYFSHQLGYDRVGYGFMADPNEFGNSASSFGYCNAGYYQTTADPLPKISEMTDPFKCLSFDGFGAPTNNSLPEYNGAPQRIAGLTWFNRPFASPYELMMVPLTSPGQFGLHHSSSTTVFDREMNGFVPSYQTTNAWNVDLATLPLPSPPSFASYWAKPETLKGSDKRVADWPLLLEFVETQAPFIDANKYYRPDTMLAMATADNVAARFLNSFLPAGYTLPDSTVGTDPAVSEPATTRGPSLLGPYNMKPSYVATGKINLNTVAFDSLGNSRALKSIEHNYLGDERASANNSLATSFINSRQGFNTVGKNIFLDDFVPNMDPKYPTRFVGAYRPAMSSNLAPALDDANPAANQNMRGRFGVESTLLRSFDAAKINSNSETVTTVQSAASNREMLFAAKKVSDDLDSVQPFVRMQRAMRLPNLVTNQSNVFAVWVTVSLFEYDPISGFGNEYVGETGLPERERQFFIIDRTIPVGFKPGEDLNTDRTILLQRKLP